MGPHLTDGIVRILTPDKSTAGTGFVIGEDGLIATCAHVVLDAEAGPGGTVSLVFPARPQEIRTAVVTRDYWRDDKAEDVAILRLEDSLPEGVTPLPLRTYSGKHDLSSFGFPQEDPSDGRWGHGQVLGPLKMNGFNRLQLRSEETTKGFSGAPVWDDTLQAVIGMIIGIGKGRSIEWNKQRLHIPSDLYGRFRYTAFATPTETLREVCPLLQVSSECPYRGLEAFTEDNAQFFYGRDAFVNTLLERLRDNPRFLAVFGPSGSGKSSVMRAGLIPKLREGALLGSANWEITIIRPADDPFQLRVATSPQNSDNFTERVGAWLAQHPEPTTRFMLVVDQFEELLASKDLKPSTLIGRLTNLLDSSPSITLIIVMRNDFYSQFTGQESLRQWLDNSRAVNIPQVLTRSELEAIIREPAKRANIYIQDGLFNLLVKDAIGEGEQEARSTILPLLEFTLTRLWEKRQDETLTLDAYNNMHGIRDAFTSWANITYDKLQAELPLEHRHLVQRIFMDLVYIGDEHLQLPNSRQRKPLTSLYYNASELKPIQEIVNKLVDARLLVESEGGIEIIHDVLLKEWDYLKNWIKANRTFSLWHQRLAERVREWVTTDIQEPAKHADDMLLRGRDLIAAEQWLMERKADLNLPERDFIQASRERQEREEQHWKELYEESERRRQIALARQLAVQAEQKRSQHFKYPTKYPHMLQTSMLLALESMRRYPLPEVSETLHLGAILLRKRVLSLSHNDGVVTLAFSPDGHILATACGNSSRRNSFACLWDASSGQQLAVLSHEGNVNDLAFTPDGSLLATAGSDNTVSLWAVPTGQQIATLAHEGTVNVLAFSPDGRLLATGSNDQTAVLWDPNTGQRLATLLHNDSLTSVAFSPDGSLLVTGSINDGWDMRQVATTILWDTHTGQRLITFAAQGKVIALSPDGCMLAATCENKDIALWDIAKSIEFAAQNPHDRHAFTSETVPVREGPLLARFPAILSTLVLVFSPDGRLLATGSASPVDAVALWDTETDRDFFYFKSYPKLSYTASVSSLAFSPDGRLLAVGDNYGIVTLCGIPGRELIATLPYRDRINAITFSPDGRLLATACRDGVVNIWDIASRSFTSTIDHQEAVKTVAFSPSGRLLATASKDKTVGLWTVGPDNAIATFATLALEKPVTMAIFSPNGRLLAATDGKIVSIWDSSTKRLIATFTPEDGVRDVAFSPDGRLLATAGFGTADLWDTSSGRRLATLHHRGGSNVMAVAFSSNGHLLATASIDYTAGLWDVSSGQRLATFTHTDEESAESGGLTTHGIFDVAFSPDSKLLATASEDYTAGLWDVSSGQRLAILSHRLLVTSVVFSPDGRLLATGSNDQTAVLWDPNTGQRLATLLHNDSLTSVAFSPDGSLLVTASEDHTARIWEVPTGHELIRVNHEKRVNMATFSPDGRLLATASEDGTACVLLWPPEDLIAEVQSSLTRNLTQEEWQQYIGDEPYHKTCPNLP